MRYSMPGSQPNPISSVQAMRSYLKTLVATSLDTSALSSWIDRNANTSVQRHEHYPADAAIAVLNYYGHPLYTTQNMTQDQLDWAVLMPAAEQMIQAEDTWSSQQIAIHNATAFIRCFSTDLNWLHTWAASIGMDPAAGNEYMVNQLIDALRTCQGQNGAGSISHQTYPLPSEPV